MCYLAVVWGSRTLFSLSFLSFFEFWQSFNILLQFTVAKKISFTLSWFLFYSVILEFLGYHWFSPFAPLSSRTNVVSAALVTGPFLILHYFLLLRFLIQKSLADFHVLRGVLKGWPLFFPSPRLLGSSFSDPQFGCFHFSHFSQVNWFLFARLKYSQPPSFMVLLLGFLEVSDPYLWVVSSQAFWSIFCIIGWLIGTYLFWFFVFLGMTPWIVLIPT